MVGLIFTAGVYVSIRIQIQARPQPLSIVVSSLYLLLNPESFSDCLSHRNQDNEQDEY